jgi:hypothetical protein
MIAANRAWESLPYPETQGELLRRHYLLYEKNLKAGILMGDGLGWRHAETNGEAGLPAISRNRIRQPRRSALHKTQKAVHNRLPMFASEDAIAHWLMGPGRANEWRQFAPILETRGLPKVDALMGGRYVPGVKAFFDREYGLREVVPRVSPSGAENLGEWNRRCPRTKRQRPA